MDITYVLLISFLIISTLGTLLHFTKGWFKYSVLLQVVSAVNESTWEHMKLLVFPTVVVMVIQNYLFNMNYPNLFNSILILLLVQTVSIPLLYEPLRMIFRKVHLLVTILIFYVSVLIGVLAQYYVLKNGISIFNEQTSLIVLGIVVLTYWIFTYYPPRLYIFRDPNTGIYGYRGNGE